MTTTPEGYKSLVTSDTRSKDFNKITVDEPVDSELMEILANEKSIYESHHHVVIPNDVLVTIASLSSKYIHSMKNPLLSMDIIDRIGSTKSLESTKLLPWRNAVMEYDFVTASKLRNVFLVDHTRNKIETSDVTETISLITGKKVLTDDSSRVDALKSYLIENIVNQKEAIDLICDGMKTSLMFNDAKRPIGSYIFVGSSSVGKTYMAELISNNMFDGKILRLNMSDYMERHTVSRLIGSPPGYVGYQEGGILTEFVRNNPYCVILFDEIEKAHPDVHNILLSILDAGVLEDMSHSTSYFNNTLVIMTGNIGTSHILSNKEYRIGFGNSKLDKKSDVLKEVKEAFTPALMDRIGKIVVFNTLSKDDLVDVIDLEINKLISNTSPGIVFTDKTKEKLLSDWMPGDGARTVRKKIINVINIIATDNQLDKDKKIYTIDHDEENDVYIISDVKNKCCAVME
jgi:ATP-dependent Clp protease ATP-binding subunit ClpC